LVTAVLLVALLDASAAVAQGDDANAAAVRAVLEAQAAAWNRGDIDAYMTATRGKRRPRSSPATR
jgi:hypothetical protein